MVFAQLLFWGTLVPEGRWRIVPLAYSRDRLKVHVSFMNMMRGIEVRRGQTVEMRRLSRSA